jgi:hypothetical protein
MNECEHNWAYNYPRESVCSKCGMRMSETVKVSDEKINTLIVQMAENTAAIVAVLKWYGNHRWDCNWNVTKSAQINHTCTCGFEKALADAAERKPKMIEEALK